MLYSTNVFFFGEYSTNVESIFFFLPPQTLRSISLRPIPLIKMVRLNLHRQFCNFTCHVLHNLVPQGFKYFCNFSVVGEF